MTKLASALPKTHGLGALDQLLINHPNGTHLIIARVDASKLTTDVDTGDVEPTVRILAIERVDPADDDTAATMLRAAAEAPLRRCGAALRPRDRGNPPRRHRMSTAKKRPGRTTAPPARKTPHKLQAPALELEHTPIWDALVEEGLVPDELDVSYARTLILAGHGASC